MVCLNINVFIEVFFINPSLQYSNTPDRQRRIHLGGTARNVKDIQAIQRMGLQFAEIPVNDPVAFSKHIHTYEKWRLASGLYYLCHGPREGDPNDRNSLEHEYLPKILAILPLMKRLRMSLLTVHLWLDARFVRKEVIEFKIELLGEIITHAQEAGIMICHENLSERASDMEKACLRLPLLNITLDLGHAQLLTEVNRSFDYIDQFPEKIKHIHLHDNDGGTSHLDDLHLPPGQGIVDFRAIFKRLKQMGYHHTITLELKPHEIKDSLGKVRALLD